MSALIGLPERTWIDGVETGQLSVLDRGLQYGDGLLRPWPPPAGGCGS